MKMYKKGVKQTAFKWNTTITREKFAWKVDTTQVKVQHYNIAEEVWPNSRYVTEYEDTGL